MIDANFHIFILKFKMDWNTVLFFFPLSLQLISRYFCGLVKSLELKFCYLYMFTMPKVATKLGNLAWEDNYANKKNLRANEKKNYNGFGFF